MHYARPTPLGQVLRWLAAAGLIGVTPVLGWVSWRTYQSAKATAAWPTVTGEITRVQLRDVGKRDGYQRYETDVAYAYRVDGRKYTGTRIRATDPYHKLEAAEAAIADLAEGQARTVYYNPADPAESLLVPGAISGEAWLMTIPAFTLAGGLAILVWLMRNWGNPNARVLRYGPSW